MNKEQGDEENNKKKKSIPEGVPLTLQIVHFSPIVPSLLNWFFLPFFLCHLLVIFLFSSSPIFFPLNPLFHLSCSFFIFLLSQTSPAPKHPHVPVPLNQSTHPPHLPASSRALSFQASLYRLFALT